MTSLFSSAEAPSTSLSRLDHEQVEARSLPDTPASPADVRAAGWRLQDLWLPAVVCGAEALDHNLDRFAGWCTAHEVSHAPHGKTTMAPQLWSAQLRRGAWAMTAATVAQARTMRRYGVPRVLLANEVTDSGQLRWVAQAASDPDFEMYCLVDGHACLRALHTALEEAGASRPLPVLVELGVPGRRTGVRGTDEALDLAASIADSPRMLLAGVEGYEGVLPTRRDEEATEDARAWLRRLAELAVACDERGLFSDSPEVVLTAGGSAFFDLVADTLGGVRLSRPVRPVVRSGCYVSHDHLSYERSSALRSGADTDPLRPALTCFARVLSCPEPGRALLGVGKRDVAFDIDLPLPLAVRRDGSRTPLRGARVVELNDHHGFVDDEDGALAVGDVVELGLSHPCTVFDKWALIPVLDREERVVDAVRTVF